MARGGIPGGPGYGPTNMPPTAQGTPTVGGPARGTMTMPVAAQGIPRAPGFKKGGAVKKSSRSAKKSKR